MEKSKTRTFFYVILILVIVFGLLFLFVFNKFKGEDNVFTNIEKREELKCKFIGGEMVSIGCGIAGCSSRCSKVFSDGGESCSDSSDCKGLCLKNENEMRDTGEFKRTGRKETLKTEIEGCFGEVGYGEFDCSGKKIGTCQKLEILNKCESNFEVKSGNLKRMLSGCTI